MRNHDSRHDGELAVTESEILAHTRELHDLHEDEGMPAMTSSLAEWIESNRESDAAAKVRATGVVSRRNLLLGSGAAAVGGLLLAACSGSSGAGNAARTTTTNSSGGASSLSGDLKVAGLAASLENLGVYAYAAGIKAAKAGKLGTVPPAVVTFATTAMNQHKQHAAAWNAVITSAGKKVVTETDPALTPTVNTMFGKVTDVGGLAKLALEIENIAAQTYQSGIGALSSTKAIETAATIQPVELQHAAILNLILGNNPAPNAFNPTSLARAPSDLSA